jgi:hypothetical protein
MARISTYTRDTSISRDDLLMGTDADSSDATKNFPVGDLADFISGTQVQIPTPQMWVYKSGNLNPYQTVGTIPTLKQRALCISVPTQIDKTWLDKNPRLFLFRYRPSNTSFNSSSKSKRGNYVHPTHLNGDYIQTNFPGSDWCSSPQNYIDNQGYPSELFPITTEWDFNGDLKYVQKYEYPLVTPGVAITDFKTVNSTAYVEVPFNPLQFLFGRGNPETPFTSFPVSIDIDLSTRCMIRTGSDASNSWNTNTPWDQSGSESRKAYFKFAIGIPNPTWTNTNKQTPYIMGDLSDAVTFQYQESSSNIVAYQIVQGNSSMISRTL